MDCSQHPNKNKQENLHNRTRIIYYFIKITFTICSCYQTLWKNASFSSSSKAARLMQQSPACRCESHDRVPSSIRRCFAGSSGNIKLDRWFSLRQVPVAAREQTWNTWQRTRSAKYFRMNHFCRTHYTSRSHACNWNKQSIQLWNQLCFEVKSFLYRMINIMNTLNKAVDCMS